jgi:hypothetical protein
VVVDEVRREGVDEQRLLAGLGVSPHDRVLGVLEALLEGETLLDRQLGAEGRLDAVAGTKVGDLLLDVLREATVGLDHVHPDGVPAHLRALDTAQHGTHRGGHSPRGVAVERVLVVFGRAVEVLVDAHQPWVLGVAAGDRVVLQRAEPLGERDVLGTGDVLVAEEEDLVLEQQVLQLGEQVVARGDVGEAHATHLGADEGGEPMHLEGARLTRCGDRAVADNGLGHAGVLLGWSDLEGTGVGPA